MEVPPHKKPELDHVLKHDSSVLALVVSHDSIYTGTQDGEIVVWSLKTFEQTSRVQAHKRSVMWLHLSQDGSLLFSSATEPVVNVWDPRTLTRLCEIYSTHDSFGDVYCVAYSAQHDTVYFGAQNTSIQWVGLRDPSRKVAHDSPRHPDRRNHQFFDSRAVGGASTPRPIDERCARIPRPNHVLEVDRRAYKLYAHPGYVLCMLMAKGVTAYAEPDEDILISGCGGGVIRIWKLGRPGVGADGIDNGLQLVAEIGEVDFAGIKSLAIDGSFLYSGKKKGSIELWDLDTMQKLRVIKDCRGDIESLQMGWGYLWSAGSDGIASKHSTVHYEDYQPYSSRNVSQKYQCLTQWKAHEGKILVSATLDHQGNQLYVTGANDNHLSVWVVENPPAAEQPSPDENEDMMVTSLRDFVSYKTVSSKPEFAEDCRRGATFLRTLFRKHGGDVEMLSTDNDRHHPVVFAKFSGKLQPAEQRKRILFYGHYDVVPAATSDTGSKWETDPFQLQGTNGYLYGRGVSDNKGPIMAALYAVTDLVQAKALDADILFLIEGEEESGSRGFREAVRKHKERIGRVDYILLANSYWLNDTTPCLTYGLRGVLHAQICVQSGGPDLHSGVDGSCEVNEPLNDLTAVVAQLTGPRNRVRIPGFYDAVLPLTAEEEARYDDIIAVLKRQEPGGAWASPGFKKTLLARWREPNLTLHGYRTSASDEGSLISSHASVKVSVRLVPGQDLGGIVEGLRGFVEERFAELGSGNRLSVKVENMAEPWLGDTDNRVYRTLERAVMGAWEGLFAGEGEGEGEGVSVDGSADGAEKGETNGDDKSSSTNGDDEKPAPNSSDDKRPATNGDSNGSSGGKPHRPLYIREGGSIPAIRFLEKEFGAPAAHLPCGQASDAAHLENERLRVVNLFKSREIFGSVFGGL